jgi:hypothetical protein
MPAKTDPQPRRAVPEYFYRRSLTAQELVPAIGGGIVVGLAVFYLARLYLQRTPLVRTSNTVAAPRWRLGISASRTPGG